MLRTRVQSAALLFLLVAVPAWLGGWPFALLMTLIATLATWEYRGLLLANGYLLSSPLLLGLSLVWLAQAARPDLFPLSLVLSVLVIGSLLLTLWHHAPQPASDWALSLAGSLYIGWLLGHFIRLRALPDGWSWLLLATFTAWAADVSAYFAGRAWGRHRWWPRHSPKKSWEGYWAGVLAAALTALGLGHLLLGLPRLEGALLGLILGLVMPLGDLAESMLKRQVGAKDSSSLIPGHGGVLDRIDTLLIAIPIVFYWAVYRPF